jgi:hypothetical protein
MRSVSGSIGALFEQLRRSLKSSLITARRSQARAMKRAGELLEQIERGKTGPKKQLRTGTRTNSTGRTEAPMVPIKLQRGRVG